MAALGANGRNIRRAKFHSNPDIHTKSWRLSWKVVKQVTEYVHVFVKNVEEVKFAPIPTDEDPSSEWDQDEIGYYREGSELLKRGEGGHRDDRPNMYFPVFIDTDGSVSLTRLSPNDTELLPVHKDGSEGRWMWSRSVLPTTLPRL